MRDDYEAEVRSGQEEPSRFQIVVRHGRQTLAILSASSRAEADRIGDAVVTRLRAHDLGWSGHG